MKEARAIDKEMGARSIPDQSANCDLSGDDEEFYVNAGVDVCEDYGEFG